MAVVRFNSATENVIGQLQRAGNAANRQALAESMQPPTDYIDTGGYTRIDLGLDQAREILAAVKGEGRPGYVLLLTDGVPTQPGDVPNQEKAVQGTMAVLQEMGTQVLPVVLCNEKAGCPDDSFIIQTIGRTPAKARTAQDLLQVFSSLLAEMKPDLHVVEQAGGGTLGFTIRPAHGAQQLVVVADKDGLQALKRDGNPVAVSRAYQDDNVLVNVVDAQGLAAGDWTVETRGASGFAVVQTDTYPELTFPPSSVPGSTVAPYYVPTGKPVAILADIIGPGSEEPLSLGDGTALKPFAPGEKLLWTVLPGATDGFTLQVGDDTAPLQIQRRFQLQARPDVPMLLAVSPAADTPCTAGAGCPLKAAFGPGADVGETQGMVYVTDESADGKLVHSAPMVCSGRECTDEALGFIRLDGHRYTVRFFVQARSGGVLFGDWAETTLTVSPSVGLRGLPASLDLKTQPADGWPVTVSTGTIQDLGQLRATIVLTRTEDNRRVADAQVVFNAGLAAAGEQTTTLRVVVPDGMRPGNYQGEISFSVDNPPQGEGVALPAPVPVSLSLAKPAGEILDSAVDFGSVLFDTSPNFRLNETALVGVAFKDQPFEVVPSLVDSTCPDLSVEAGRPELQGGSYRLPLTLHSSRPVLPQTCSGTLNMGGPSADYEILANQTIAWRVVIPEVEWQLVGVERTGTKTSDLAFGNIGRPGERGGVVLLIRYSGQAPFSLQLVDLAGEADQGGAIVSADRVALATGEVTPQAGSPGVYRVPVDLVVRRSLPQASPLATWLSGTDYSGRLHLDIVGLPSQSPREVSFRFHNPGLFQRYIAPFYGLWWPGVVTYPLSVLVPLVLLALLWLRRRDAAVEQILQSQGAASAGAEDRASATGATRPPEAAPSRSTGAGQSASRASAPAAGSFQVPKRPLRQGRKSPGSSPRTGSPASPSRQAESDARSFERPSSLPSRPLRPSGSRRAR